MTSSIFYINRGLWFEKKERLLQCGQCIFRGQKVDEINTVALCGLYVGLITSISVPPGNLQGNVALGARVLDVGEWFRFAEVCTPRLGENP